MGRIAVKDFRDLTKSGVCQVIFECGEPGLCLSPRWLAATVNLYISSDEWPHQPWPYGALVVSRIATNLVACVTGAFERLLPRAWTVPD